jgi:hypothetical protein
MASDSQENRKPGRQGRIVALVIAGTVIAWLGLQWLGSALNWEARYAFLIDFAALAAFAWALIVTWQIWRKRSE